MSIRINKEALKTAEDNASRSYPNEACGVLLGHAPSEVLEAHPCANVNTDRAKDRYLIDPKEQMRIEKEGRERGLDVVGYFHSHPDQPARASETDQEYSWEGFLYLIVSVRDGKVVDRRGWSRALGVKKLAEVALLDTEFNRIF